MNRYDPPTPRRTRSVRSADGTAIHVEEHGQELGTAPTVVLVHGWTCSTLFWAPVIRALVDDHRVVVYDQRGHGRSDTPKRGGYSTDALADDLTAVLDEVLADGEKAVLAGHSMGGMTVLAAADRPAVQTRTAAVLLASTGSGRLLRESMVLPERIRNRWIRDAFHRLLLVSTAPLGPETALTRAAFKYGVMASGSTKEQVAFVTPTVLACKRAPRAGWGRVLLELDLDAGVEALRVPTTVLVGTADKLTPLVHSRTLAARLPNCTGLTELPGLGHMTPVEDPDAVADAIGGLVRDHLENPAEVKEGGIA